MLIWSLSGRVLVWSFAALMICAIFVAPLAVIILREPPQQWNAVLPTRLHPGALSRRDRRRRARRRFRQPRHRICREPPGARHGAPGRRWPCARGGTGGGGALGVLFFVPSAVPSVSVGLGLLVAFSQKPLLLNGTTAIVFVAHYVLISAFAFGNISAGLSRLAPDYEEVASCLGARPAYRLRHVTLPLIAPYLIASFGLSFALSMGSSGRRSWSILRAG